MFNKSGYGKIIDSNRNVSAFGNIYAVNDMIIDTPINDNIRDYDICQNIKSKYIKADKYCAPIIASKSISLRNVFCNINFVNDAKESDNNNIDVPYNYIESNLYPIRNHDLLDATVNGSQLELLKYRGKKDIFFDKLIPYSNDPAFSYKSIGPLYSNSPENIPMLTKMLHVNLYKSCNNNIKVILDRKKLLDIIEVERVFNITKKSLNYNSIYSNIIVLYIVNGHFRNIKGSDVIPIEAYIPNTLITIEFPLSIKLINKYLKKYALGIKNNKDFRAPSISTIKMQVQLILDPILKSYLIYDTYKKFKESNNNYRYTIFHDILKNNTNSIHDLMQSNIVNFPFGNVYDSNKVCMKNYKMSEWAFDIGHIYNCDYTIDIANVINGSYSDFFDSNFNSDLRKYHFILKSNYIDFLDNYKDSFENDKLFFNSIYKLRNEMW